MTGVLGSSSAAASSSASARAETGKFLIEGYLDNVAMTS